MPPIFRLVIVIRIESYAMLFVEVPEKCSIIFTCPILELILGKVHLFKQKVSIFAQTVTYVYKSNLLNFASSPGIVLLI